MADKYTRSPKKTFNPLLNVSVTGATLEEFTQNAILCPAAEPVAAPIMQAIPLNDQPEPEPSANTFTDISQQLTNNQAFEQQYFDQTPTYQSQYNNQTLYSAPAFPPPVTGITAPIAAVTDSNISTLSSSVLSSFSNILSFGSQPKKDIVEEELVGPNPNSVEHLLNSSVGVPSVSFVPFYPTHGDSFALSGPPLTGSSLSGLPLSEPSLSGPPLTGPSLSGSSLPGPPLTRPSLSRPAIPASEFFERTSVPSPGLSGSVISSSKLSTSPTHSSAPGLYSPTSFTSGYSVPGLTPFSGSSAPVSGISTPELLAPVRPASGQSASAEILPTSGLFGPGIPPTGLSRQGISSTSGPVLPPSSLSGPGLHPSSVSGPGLLPSSLSGPGLPPSLVSGPGLSSSSLSGPGLSSSSLSGPGLLSSSLSGPGLPPSSLSGPGLPPSSLSGPGLPSSSLSGPGLAPSSLAEPGLPPSTLSGPVLAPSSLSGSGKSSSEAGIHALELSGPTIPTTGLPPTAAKGLGNTYRRQGQKRVAYAPIPGFSSTPLQSAPQSDSNLYFPAATYDQHQPNTASSAQLQPETHAPSIFALPPVTDTKPPNLLIPSTDFSEVQSLDGTPSTFLTPIMSDVQSSTNTNPATLNSSATLHTLSGSITPTPMAGADAGQSKPATIMNSAPYRPVYHHWFHRKEIEGRVIWQPFSMVDSLALEAAFVSTDISPENMVATEGGRYDVNILRRQRSAVYWESTPTEVRRCSWFYKTTNDGKFTPYEENIATKLEEEYKAAYEVNQWHRKVDLPNGETVVFHAPDVLVLFPQSSTPDVWNQTPQSALRPRVVKRGMDEFDIDEGEPGKIDHLLFLCHGIGSVCDLKFRSVEEVVDDFRSISLQLIQSHYKSSCDQGIANRIEVLPVSWHNQLHSDDTGIDRKLKSITLESIPRLRDFTNDTLLDILFYTSPIYSQTIISTVGNELNRIYALFKQRNPGFKGNVSVGGHSLGSLILFDILGHQHPIEKEDDSTPDGDNEDTIRPLNKKIEKPPPASRRLSRRISYMMGAVGTGQPQLIYPHLNFNPVAFFALGSPIGMFVTVRGLESLGEQFALPTCPGFFNIFHPYDPVAYRIESLINPELANTRPVLIPHHKGRKRMHLELKETMARVGADLKQRIVDSMKSTWNSVYQLAMFHRSDNKSLEAEVDKVLKEQLANEERERMRTESVSEEDGQTDLPVGILNNGRRIDYVLQEAPFEFFNEYIFALTSHVCYWESEDTMLLILKEIYNSMGISVDSQIPQQTMTIERSSPSPVDVGPRSLQMANPLRPMVYNPSQGPPPTAGFVRKT